MFRSVWRGAAIFGKAAGAEEGYGEKNRCWAERVCARARKADIRVGEIREGQEEQGLKRPTKVVPKYKTQFSWRHEIPSAFSETHTPGLKALNFCLRLSGFETPLPWTEVQGYTCPPL